MAARLEALEGYVEESINRALTVVKSVALRASDTTIIWDKDTDTFILTARLSGAVVRKGTEPDC